jgi:uncharacterized protein YukE
MARDIDTSTEAVEELAIAVMQEDYLAPTPSAIVAMLHALAAERDAAAADARVAGDAARHFEADRDRLAAKVERMRDALEIIAGQRQCIDNLMGNDDIARAALAGDTDAK